MKRILIAGANSYIGTSLERYLLEYNASQGRERYRVDTISQRDSQWEDYDFRGYDAVFQASGIAHVDTGAVKQEQQALYYRVNCDLAAGHCQKGPGGGGGAVYLPQQYHCLWRQRPLWEEPYDHPADPGGQFSLLRPQ